MNARIKASLAGFVIILAASLLVSSPALAQAKAAAKAAAKEAAPSEAVAKNEPAASTASAPTPSQYKIAVVDRKKAFDNYEKQKKELAALEAAVKVNQDEVDKISNQVEADWKKHDEAKKNGTMTPDQLAQFAEEIKSNLRRYQATFKALQGDIDSKHKSLIGRMKQDIDNAIAEIGNAGNFHLILEGDLNSPQGALYYASSIDITPQVIERLNSKAGKTSGSAAPSGAGEQSGKKKQ